MRIFICRHTKVHNPQQVVYRRTPGFHLSKEGEKEAELVGKFLERLKIKEFFVSPMERCQEVARIAKNAIGDHSIKISTKEYLNEWGEGERTIAIAGRMAHILRSQKSHRLYITHKDPIRVFLNKITGESLKELERWDCPHGAVYEIKKKNGKVSVKFLFAPKLNDGAK